jgi:hypothetical protein
MPGHPIESVEQIEKIKNWLKHYKPDLYNFFVLAINSGVDPSKLLRVTGRDLLKKEKYKYHAKKVLFGHPLNFVCTTLIEDVMQPFYTDTLIFKNPTTKKVYNNQTVNRILKDAGKDETLSMACLPKTFLYHAIKNGVPVNYLTNMEGTSKKQLEKKLKMTVEEILSK